MAIRVIDDTKLNNIAVAIQAKDNGGQMMVDEMPTRIEALPLEQNFDMTVTNNQTKMVIEVGEGDLSFWTRFGQTANSIVTVGWGDETQDVYTETDDRALEYASQRKHQYQKAGLYLVTETIENGTLSVGSINEYSTLSEGPLSGYYNSKDKVRRMYNSKIKELSFGGSITVTKGFTEIPFVIIHNDFNFSFRSSGTDYIVIKEGTSTIDSYWFASSTAYSIKIPPSVNTINNNAFENCQVRIIDFTDIELTEQGELPFSISATNVFRGSASTILLFKTQEIAEVAKNTTNLSVYASKIKYEGEEY